MRQVLSLVLLSAIAVLPAAPQQTKPDFSGRWVLDLTKTEAPAQPPEMEQVIDHKDPVLKWTTKFKDTGASETMLPFLIGIADGQAEVRADGKEEAVKNGPFERRSHTVWDGQRLVTTWTMKTPQDPPEGRWVRSLSADGKTQIIDIEFRSAVMGTVQAKLIFSKR